MSKSSVQFEHEPGLNVSRKAEKEVKKDELRACRAFILQEQELSLSHVLLCKPVTPENALKTSRLCHTDSGSEVAVDADC